jgi:hypothetical protein
MFSISQLLIQGRRTLYCHTCQKFAHTFNDECHCFCCRHHHERVFLSSLPTTELERKSRSCIAITTPAGPAATKSLLQSFLSESNHSQTTSGDPVKLALDSLR